LYLATNNCVIHSQQSKSLETFGAAEDIICCNSYDRSELDDFKSTSSREIHVSVGSPTKITIAPIKFENFNACCKKCFLFVCLGDKRVYSVWVVRQILASVLGAGFATAP
jgi:hypothetical protein